jgi:hypothetical protein
LTVLRSLEFWAALSVILAAVVFMVAVALQWVSLGFFVGPFRVNHWFVLIGTLYIAFVVPVIAVAKQRYPSRFKALFRLHVFGNLSAFILISVHFASQITRPAAFYPDLGTGLALYIVMILLVATGFTHRFQLLPQIKSQTRKFVHVGLSFSFYIIIIIHMLHGFGFL